MKKGKNGKFLYNENDECIGINLGAEHATEHEIGIDGIKEMFGITDKKEKVESRFFHRKINQLLNIKEFEPLFGIERRVIRKNQNIKIRKVQRNHKTHYVLVADLYNRYEKTLPNELNLNYFSDINKKEVGTAWDENGFGIIVDKSHKKELEMLVRAFNDLDIIIEVGKSMAFQNAGLIIMKKSAINEQVANEMYQQDKDFYGKENEKGN